MLNRRWIVTCLVVCLAGGVAPLGAAASEIRFTVSVPHPDADGGIATNQLRLGTAPSASDAFDPSLDLEALPSPGLSAVVRHPEYSSLHQSLWWDLRAPTLPQAWEVEVKSDRPNARITLSAPPLPTAPNACSESRWTVRDTETNQTLQLGPTAAVYSYLNTPGVVRRFTVSAAASVDAPPPPPHTLWSPRQGRASVYLAWAGTNSSAARYHVYRETDHGPVRLSATPITTASYVDTGVNRTLTVTYFVTAVGDSGCESGYSVPLTLAPHR